MKSRVVIMADGGLEMDTVNMPGGSDREDDTAAQACDDAPPGYEAPAIVYRAPLEATAAFCDPVEYGKTEGYCGLGPINS